MLQLCNDRVQIISFEVNTVAPQTFPDIHCQDLIRLIRFDPTAFQRSADPLFVFLTWLRCDALVIWLHINKHRHTSRNTQSHMAVRHGWTEEEYTVLEQMIELVFPA